MFLIGHGLYLSLKYTSKYVISPELVPATSSGALHQENIPVLQFKCKFCCMDKDLLTALRQH